MDEASAAPPNSATRLEGSATLRLESARRPATPLVVDPAVPEVPGYVVQREIGRGGMGVVYRARHVQLNRNVALKMILTGVHAGKNAVSRFWTEAQTVAKLQHPGIVQVYDYGVHNGLPYCALELAPGGSLADRTRGQVSSPHGAARLVMQLARTMQAAHAAGVVHRDLKPGNVLFTADGQPKITDFGIAKTLGDENNSATLTGEILGTPNYMAPEQAWGASKVVGPAADVYALGVILYEQLTGQVPFIGQDRLDILTRVRTMEPVSPRRRVPSVPVDLDMVCLKCLEKEPGRRYMSAEEFADDLERFLTDRPVLARRPDAFERTLRWRRRNPQLAAMIAALATLFVLAFALVTWSYLQAQTALREEAVQRKLERWERYRAEISAASSALQLHNTGAARQALEAAPEELRGWEWSYFHRRLDAASEVHVGQDSPIHVVSLASDGGRAFLISRDRSLRGWDVRRGTETARLPDFQSWINPSTSSDGSLVARSTSENSVELWDGRTWKVRSVLRGHPSPVDSAAFSVDSTRVATASTDGMVCVWNAATGGKLFEQRIGPPAAYVTSIDRSGERMAITSRGGSTVSLWRVGEQRPYAELRGHGGVVTYGRFSPDGGRVLTLEHFPHYKGRLWDSRDGRLIAVLAGHVNEVVSFAFSQNGKLLATGSMDQTARIWSLADGRLVSVLKGHSGRVLGLGFNRDATQVVTASQDHTVRVWDVASGSQSSVLHGHTQDVDAAAFLDDARIVSISKDRTIRCWDVDSVVRDGALKGHTSFVYSVAFDPEGDRLATCAWDGTARIWNSRTGRRIRSLPHGDSTIVSSVAWSPDCAHVATIVRDGTVRWWDASSGSVLRTWKVSNGTWRDTRIAVGPDGKSLAVGGERDEIHVFDVESGGETRRIEGRGGFSREVAFSPDGRWLASAVDEGADALRIWSAADGVLRHESKGLGAGVYAVAFSGDSKTIATGSIDGTARLWDVETGAQTATFDHGSNVYGVAFTPDGARLACGCADGTIHLWDVRTRQQVAELHGHGAYVHSVAFSPDGGRLASASGDFTAKIWTADEATAAEAPSR